MLKLSHSISVISIVAGALLAASVGNVSAKNNGNKGHQMGNRGHQMNAPSRASDVGIDARSSRAATRGANQKRFCPPGQAKKPGRGTAFNC